jgi:hypothetical protein
MSDKPKLASPFPFPMKNNGGNSQQNSFNWFMEQEKNSSHSGGDKSQQISVVQFDHVGPPTAISGTSISKKLTDTIVNAKNDAMNDSLEEK